MLSRVRSALRRSSRKLVIAGSANGLARLARLHPHARPARHGVERINDVRYGADYPEHVLDVYRPLAGRKILGTVLYLHGGGFTQLSKDTHWVMGLAFARAGYLVFNASYRLAPRYPYPAALEDAARAYCWVVENARDFGGDSSRLILAGESAGANLVTALTVATCFERPEPFAAEVFATGVVPVATLPMCGILQVTEPERFWQRRDLPWTVRAVLGDVSTAYLTRARVHPRGGVGLADPLLILESGEVAARPLPPMFASVGTRDPLLPDTRRLERALDERSSPCEVAYVEGEPHAFQAFVWRRASRENWRRTYAFLRAL